MQLAIDLVRMYLQEEFAIGLVASTDTDLLPALEAVLQFDRKRGTSPVEVCAWSSPTCRKQLRVKGTEIPFYALTADDFERVRDDNDYNVSFPRWR